MSEKPNNKATVAVLCPYIFFAQAYSGLVRQMPNAEIVPDYTASPAGTLFSDEAKREFREWLSKSDLPWRDIETSGDSPANFFAKYGTVVAPFYGGWVRNPVLKAHKKGRVFYGAAKDIWGFSLWNAHFDLICTPGPYFTDTLNDLYGRYGTLVVSTGEPKLDDYATLTKVEAQKKLDIDDDRPVVLVAATWGKLSALERIAPSLITLSGQYKVVVKAHHRSSTLDPDSLKVFDGTAVRVIGQTTPVPVALAAADVMISDGSGAIFDAVRANKPLVIIDTIGIPDDEFFIETYYGRKEEKLAGTTAYGASTEQRIKRPGEEICPIVDAHSTPVNPQRLQAAIEEALTHADRYVGARSRLMASHFVPIDGKAGERVAREIEQLAHAKKPSSSRSSHLFSSLVTDFYERAKAEEALLRAGDADHHALEVERIRHIKSLPYTSRLRAVIHEFFD